jgi:transposase
LEVADDFGGDSDVFWELPSRSWGTQLYAAPKKAPHPKKTVTAARIQWASLVKEGGHLATLKALQEELEELIEQKIALTTLREWITDVKKPKAPPYYREDNDATYFWKRLASQQQ